ncbi:MAG: CBS domain-containing protein [Candidatus Omnitrophica bacterium]|nr:CBS domain-containing protein [Candidatus Omnitrophota bacterium]
MDIDSNIKKLFINGTISLKEAMKKISKEGQGVLIVVDGQSMLMGMLTDGDIRRAILSGHPYSDAIDGIYNDHPHFVSEPTSHEQIRNIMLQDRIEAVPVVDDNKRIIDVVFWDDIISETVQRPKRKLNVPVVIMAGGKGTRLDPFTRILPKLLIPIGEKAIIDIIIDKFAFYGITQFYISINNKAKIVKAYFEERYSDYHLHYLEETRPLGTAGSLKALPRKFKGSFFVSNCDIIVDCDYSDIYGFHCEKNNDITIVGSHRHFVIPYGVCEIKNGGTLKSINEKPEYDFLVNTGMVVLKRSVLKYIPRNKEFHMTDLISSVQQKGGKVGVYPIDEKSWIDVGQWDEYKKVMENFEKKL